MFILMVLFIQQDMERQEMVIMKVASALLMGIALVLMASIDAANGLIGVSLVGALMICSMTLSMGLYKHAKRKSGQ